MIESREVLVLGAGVTGLAAATQLGDRATLVERDDRPGGLVRTLRLDAWWFDHVLHVLYFRDEETARLIRALMSDCLRPCRPNAWVETLAGTTRFPFQMHLGSLPADLVARCLCDLAARSFGPPGSAPRHFKDYLLGTFGQAMCDTFLFPYNEKLWGRSLETLAPSGFQWNITRPDFAEVVEGALDPDRAYSAYNSDAYYPQAVPGSPPGMEQLSAGLARHVRDLRLGSTVESIDLADRVVRLRDAEGRASALRWQRECLSTLPLPHLLDACIGLPEGLRRGSARLRRNRVVMVYLALDGERPASFGHWRYYCDKSVCFTRLISMTDFDPAAAPPEGWGLMAELVEPAEAPLQATDERLARVIDDARRVGALHAHHHVAHFAIRVIDPAYVVFGRDDQTLVEEARSFLATRGITPLGRYGRWEYSSMAQCLRDGFRWGQAVAQRIGHGTEDCVRWRGDLPDGRVAA